MTLFVLDFHVTFTARLQTMMEYFIRFTASMDSDSPKHLGSSWAVHFRHRGQPSAVTSCQPCLLHLEENIRKHGSLRLSYFDDRLQGGTEERSLREGSSDACRMGKTQAIRDDGHWGVQAEGSSWEADSISWPREMGRDGWPGSAWNNSQSALSL